jgi:pimeloyl-ACP methyl ester carboxylesterase
MMGVNGLLAERVLPIMTGDTVRTDPARSADRERLKQALMKNGRSIYKAVRGVLEREGVVDELKNIRVPTRILYGTEDQAIARERAQLLLEHIDGADWVDIPGAGHTSTLENPEAVTAAIAEFLDSVGTESESRA